MKTVKNKNAIINPVGATNLAATNQKMPKNESELYFYAIGYSDGLNIGSRNSEIRENWYKRGYDAGVAEFAMREDVENGDHETL